MPPRLEARFLQRVFGVGILNDRLAGREWLTGKSFTFADLTLSGVLGFATMMGGLSLEGRPNIVAWVSRCQQRPAFARAMSA
jgi:glutathione S-transferase